MSGARKRLASYWQVPAILLTALAALGYIIHVQQRERAAEASARMDRVESILVRNGGPPSRRNGDGEFWTVVSDLASVSKLRGGLSRKDVVRLLGTPDWEGADGLQYEFMMDNVTWWLDVACEKDGLVRDFAITRPDWFDSPTTAATTQAERAAGKSGRNGHPETE